MPNGRLEVIERLHATIAAVRNEFAPDPRLCIYEVMVVEDAGALRVAGFISEPSAIEALRRRLALLDGAQELGDEIVRLPELKHGESGHALVTAAVAPLLAGPVVSEAHVSQALLGQHLMVLRERGRWLNVRAEDGYLGWVHRGYVHRTDETGARAWQLGGSAEVHLSLGAELRTSDGELLAPLPWGARVLCDGSDGSLPDGRTGRVIGEVIAASKRGERFPAVGEAIIETAGRWIGAPYLWGGTTPAGADCSGFVQAVYRMHGVELPRDSDQQARAGSTVEPGRDFSGLRAGDLLFFAEHARRVSHVAVSLGGSGLIHSALGNGGVKRNDLAGGTPFEQELRRLLVGARRVIPD